MKIKIKVTKEILNAEHTCQLNPTKCAIAQACREIFPNAWVASDTLFYLGAGVGTVSELRKRHPFIPLPISAIEFIRAFDRAADIRLFKPFEFSVDVPESVIQSIGINQAYRILSESKTLELAENFDGI